MPEFAYLIKQLILMGRCMVIALLLLSSISMSAQHDVSVETTIRNLEEIVVMGILSGDSNLLKEVWDENFLVNTPRNNIAASRNAVFETQSRGMIDYSRFERKIEHMMFEGDVVITMGSEIFVSRTDIPGAKAGVPVSRRFTNVWRMKDGKSVQIARHASIICTQ